MPWQFEVSTGKFSEPPPDADVIGIGYSGGACGQQPEAVNNSKMENVVGVGPLPHGSYDADYIMNHPHLGPFAIHLAPDPETRARIISYGRDPDSFFCHGDDIKRAGQRAASDGCIILARDVREEFWGSLDHELIVVTGPYVSNIVQ